MSLAEKATALKTKLEKDREQAVANLTAINGALQALDLLLQPDKVDGENEAIPAG